MAKKHRQCRNCHKEASDGELYGDGMCASCHPWLSLNHNEKAKRIRRLISAYPVGHAERIKYEKIAREIKKGVDSKLTT